MASQTDVDAVKSNLPDDAGDGWTDSAIGALLDSGLSVVKVTLAFWASRVAKYSALVDVAESGSSRNLSQLFQQAKTTHDMWLARSKAEDDMASGATRNRIRFHTAVRR